MNFVEQCANKVLEPVEKFVRLPSEAQSKIALKVIGCAAAAGLLGTFLGACGGAALAICGGVVFAGVVGIGSFYYFVSQHTSLEEEAIQLGTKLERKCTKFLNWLGV